MKIVQPSVTLLAISNEPYRLIEVAGRTCYKSEDKITDDSAVKFSNMIKQRGHESVVEHAIATFKIICDRGISHEIVRHRIASFSQESTRYCNYSKDKFDGEISVIIPPDLLPCSPPQDPTVATQVECTCPQCVKHYVWADAMEMAEDCYLVLLNSGVSPQIARSVLPTCLKTELVMTANFREWMHFIKLRTSNHAHPQIRPIAEEIRRILATYCPTIFTLPDHSELVLSTSEVEALRSYILANGKGSEVNPTQLKDFQSLLSKLRL